MLYGKCRFPGSWHTGMIRIAAVWCAMGIALADDVKRIPTNEAMSAVISKPSPEYPAVAKQLKMEGSVEVKVTITEDGSVGESETVSGNPILAKAAIEAVKRWKFKPFKDDGKNVKVMTNVTVAFKL